MIRSLDALYENASWLGWPPVAPAAAVNAADIDSCCSKLPDFDSVIDFRRLSSECCLLSSSLRALDFLNSLYHSSFSRSVRAKSTRVLESSGCSGWSCWTDSSGITCGELFNFTKLFICIAISEGANVKKVSNTSVLKRWNRLYKRVISEMSAKCTLFAGLLLNIFLFLELYPFQKHKIRILRQKIA